MGSPFPPPFHPTPHDAPPTDGRPGRVGRILWVVLPLLALVVIGVLRPGIIVGVVRSPQALLIVGALVLGTLLLGVVLRRLIGNVPVRTALTLVPTAVFAVVYLAPAFAPDKVVDEAFPVALTDTAAATDTEATEPPSTGTNAGGLSTDPAPTASADQSDPAPTDDAPGLTGAPNPAPPPTQDEAQDEAQDEPAPAGPIELSRGSFVGLDSHTATGDAAIYDLGDGTRIVRLEDVDLQRVPEPYVYLVPVADATGPVEGYLDLGPLSGNVGSSNYEIPADADLSGEWTVLVWCRPFASPVGGATQPGL